MESWENSFSVWILFLFFLKVIVIYILFSILIVVWCILCVQQQNPQGDFFVHTSVSVSAGEGGGVREEKWAGPAGGRDRHRENLLCSVPGSHFGSVPFWFSGGRCCAVGTATSKPATALCFLFSVCVWERERGSMCAGVCLQEYKQCAHKGGWLTCKTKLEGKLCNLLVGTNLFLKESKKVCSITGFGLVRLYICWHGLPVKLNWRANYVIYCLEPVYFSKSRKRSLPSD